MYLIKITHVFYTFLVIVITFEILFSNIIKYQYTSKL